MKRRGHPCIISELACTKTLLDIERNQFSSPTFLTDFHCGR
ncbi:unnamed protein product [Tetraodon nigroviridis]|uniref:(spotted green pufferfish) hypothetical protein n=1 Tax=Tetraodon nigroviridis TaxID=99883 RepID=Q4S6I6_TETNG|nr:unnamed protein product [Tetraodon nigroviridis]